MHGQPLLEEASTCATREVPYWCATLEPYERPSARRALIDLATSVVPYLALSGAMYFLIAVSPLLTLALAVPTAGFLVRTFIVFHDCTHGSFWPTRAVGDWIGRVCGVMVYVAFKPWKRDHVAHHGSSGDLDRRGSRDVPMLTLAEYEAMSPRGRLGYRLYRNPLVMFGLGPIYSMILMPRRVSRSMSPAMRRSALATNAALAVIVTGLCLLIGWQDFLLIQVPTVMLAGGTGIWLFYVQHQYEDVQWERSDDWSFADAALAGSSYLKLPKVLQFFSGNIGLHHVHHLSARVPNYNLQRAHDETGLFDDVPILTLRDALRAPRLKVWDERSRRLLTWREVRAALAAPSARLAANA